MKLSVTIITLNEEQNISRCMKSASFADEIIVVDSGSSDQTQKLAEELGAKIYNCPFKGYGQQKNFAAEKCSNEWILNIDADEEISPKLQKSIIETISNPLAHDLYKVNRITSFCDRWIKHGGWYPDKVSRLYRKSKARWTEPNVHEDLKLINEDGVIGLLDGHLNHFSFPDVKSQVLTNVKYASLGAKDLINRKKRKPYLFELITRPLFKFIECYIIKRGCLDGTQGFIIAVNAAHSMFMKYAIARLEETSAEVKKS